MKKIKNRIRIQIQHKIVKVSDCLDLYVEDYAEDEGLKAEDTMFYNSLPLYQLFGKNPVSTLSELYIRRYKKWRREQFKKKTGREIANNTLGRELTMLKSALNVAISPEYKLVQSPEEINLITPP